MKKTTKKSIMKLNLSIILTSIFTINFNICYSADEPRNSEHSLSQSSSEEIEIQESTKEINLIAKKQQIFISTLSRHTLKHSKIYHKVTFEILFEFENLLNKMHQSNFLLRVDDQETKNEALFCALTTLFKDCTENHYISNLYSGTTLPTSYNGNQKINDKISEIVSKKYVKLDAFNLHNHSYRARLQIEALITICNEIKFMYQIMQEKSENKLNSGIYQGIINNSQQFEKIKQLLDQLLPHLYIERQEFIKLIDALNLELNPPILLENLSLSKCDFISLIEKCEIKQNEEAETERGRSEIPHEQTTAKKSLSSPVNLNKSKRSKSTDSEKTPSKGTKKSLSSDTLLGYVPSFFSGKISPDKEKRSLEKKSSPESEKRTSQKKTFTDKKQSPAPILENINEIDEKSLSS